MGAHLGNIPQSYRDQRHQYAHRRGRRRPAGTAVSWMARILVFLAAQLKALAAAGYRAVAPDMRGYGQADKPEAVDQYTLFHLTGDMVGVVGALGETQAAIVGHDWGAPVAWFSALFRPDI